MKKFLSPALIASFLAAAVSVSAADSAEAVLKKHVDALGGEAAHMKVKTRKIVATMDLPGLGAVDVSITYKAPDKMRTEVNIPNMGKVVEAYDGKVAWTQSPFTGLIEKQGSQLEQAKSQADFYRDVQIAKRFDNWKVKGNEVVEGKDTIVLEGSSAGKDSETLYLDAKTYLIVRVDGSTDTPEGKTKASNYPSDYRDVDGLKMPHTVRVTTDAGGLSINIKEIKHGVDAPDSLFSKPAN